MKRILAMLLSVICVLSFTCVSTYADEKSEDEEKAARITYRYSKSKPSMLSHLHPGSFRATHRVLVQIILRIRENSTH